jgi:hypothetical protein
MQVSGQFHAPAALNQRKPFHNYKIACGIGASAGVDVVPKTQSVLRALCCAARSLVTAPTELPGINCCDEPDTVCCDFRPFSLVKTHDVWKAAGSMSGVRQTLKTEILILKTADCEVGDERGSGFV